MCGMAGVCVAGEHAWHRVYVTGGMHGGRHAWQGGMLGRGVFMTGGMHGRSVCGRGACMAGGVLWGACMAGVHGRGVCGRVCMPPSRYYEIRSICGWYASYWNAFLLKTTFSRLTHLLHKGGESPCVILILPIFSDISWLESRHWVGLRSEMKLKEPTIWLVFLIVNMIAFDSRVGFETVTRKDSSLKKIKLYMWNEFWLMNPQQIKKYWK